MCVFMSVCERDVLHERRPPATKASLFQPQPFFLSLPLFSDFWLCFWYFLVTTLNSFLFCRGIVCAAFDVFLWYFLCSVVVLQWMQSMTQWQLFTMTLIYLVVSLRRPLVFLPPLLVVAFHPLTTDLPT